MIRLVPSHRDKQRQQLLMDNIHFRQNLRMVSQNEKEMDKLHTQYVAQAIEAERNGNHALAVRYAAEAAKLKNHRQVTATMKSSLEVAHAVQSTNRAMSNIMTTARDAVGSLNSSQTLADTFALQADMSIMEDQVQAFLEQNELIMDNMGASESPVNEEGEKALAALMASSRQDKQAKLLQDTAKSLDKLPRHRAVNERSKE